jgi:predicted transcriptional regulator
MHSGIIEIDMHLRDQRVLDFISERITSATPEIQLSHDEIATAFRCHRNTARAIIHRLESAGLIHVDKSTKRGGYRYRRAAAPKT